MSARSHAHTAQALTPTLSLLRMSALQRLAGIGVVILVLWVLVALVLG